MTERTGNIPGFEVLQKNPGVSYPRGKRTQECHIQEGKERFREASFIMKLPVNGDVRYWSIPQVMQWLRENGMDLYVTDFRDRYVDGDFLLSTLDEDILRELHVHYKHISEIMNAIRTYKEQNPENIYELSEGDDSDFSGEGDDDDDDDDDDDPDEGYEPPDSVPRPSVIIQSRIAKPPPVVERPAEPDSDYEEVSPEIGIEEALRRLSTSSLKYISTTQNIEAEGDIECYDDIAEMNPSVPRSRNNSRSKEPDCPPPPPRPHRAVPPLPKEEEPSVSRKYKPSHSPPSPHDHLSSLPDTRPPEPPKIQNWKRGQRPAAALPQPNAPHPSFVGHPASVIPVAPETLDDNYELDVDPEPSIARGRNEPRPTSFEQEMYEEVSDAPAPQPPRKPLNKSPAWPPQPAQPASQEDDSGGSFSGRAAHIGKPKKPGNYPLVTVPNKMNNATNKPSNEDKRLPPAKKKVILSYTDHQLNNPPTQNSLADESVPPPVPRLPQALKSSTTTHKPLPKPDKVEKPRVETHHPRVQPGTISEKIHTGAAQQHNTADASEPHIDVSTLSVRDRMKFLQENTGNSYGQKPPVTSRPGNNLMNDMIKKQAQRRNVNTPDTGRFDSDNTDHHPEPSKPMKKHALPNLPTPSKSKSPPSPRQETPVPPLPDSLRPNRRGSVDSNASNRSADEDKGLYGYRWYESKMSRVESIRLLTERRRSDGSFVVRKSEKSAQMPFTLDVYYDGNIFHIQLRLRNDGNFAMGAEKPQEQSWPSVAQLVLYFKDNNLALTKRIQGQTIKGSTLLRD